MDPNIRTMKVFLAAVAMSIALSFDALAAQEKEPPKVNTGDQATPATTAPAPSPGWLERETLTDDWGGARTWLKERGITLKPRLTQFYQGLVAGQGDHSFEYGGKADILLDADLSKLGFWAGFSVTVHAEYNFGRDVNGRGGVIAPVNTAIFFPGTEGSDAFDLSSVYVRQRFGDSIFLMVGKINAVDLYDTKPFMGGSGIDSFWNSTFAATPSGTVPPYLFGALLTVQTKPATFGLWVYDPTSVVNKTGFEEPFSDGITIRGSVSFPVTIAGRSGHQGFVALYSSEPGTDLNDVGDTLIPPFPPGDPRIKDKRYYFSYAIDQYLYQSKTNPKEGVGLFGQFGISDGNPNKLYWSGLVGVGGVGLIPRRSSDNWGVGFYHDVVSPDLTESLAPVLRIRGETGLEIFYNFAVTPWLTLGADVQIIKGALGETTPAILGLRTVVRF